MALPMRRIAACVQRYPDRTALHLGSRRISYAELWSRAQSIADAITDGGLSKHRFVGLLASRELSAYTGVLAIMGTRRAVVPIDPDDPPARIHQWMRHAGLDTLVVGASAVDRIESLLRRTERPLSIIAPDADPLRELSARYPRHRYTTCVDLAGRRSPLLIDQIEEDDPAYLVRTSGSSAEPRGVAVSHGRLQHYLEAAEKRHPLSHRDRCSHTFPLSFDLSFHDLFTTWSAGATLVAWRPQKGIEPARLINEHRLTRWFSVPQVAMTMERMAELVPGRFPHLRRSLFCGEALPDGVARAWAKAAPQSAIYNLYGPAETTIAISDHHYRTDQPSRTCRRSTVCLGRIFEGHRAMIVGADGRRTGVDEPGELWLAGPQVCQGYWDEGKDERFVERDEGRGTWFRTGDLVERDSQGRLHFLGRTDHRIKIGGHHVDLLEVDRALQNACGHSQACTVAWPRDATRVYGLVGFVACSDDDDFDERHILARCRRVLSRPMVPHRIVALPQLPTNGHGKLDRRAMQHLLRQREV